jgi:hypothetical protein
MNFSTVAKLRRFKDIVTTLLKYGLDEAVQRLNFPGAKLVKRIYTVDREMGIYERNRLTTGMIVAVLIMGSSMIITTGVGPFIFGFPVLGVIGYLISTVMVLWLAVTILRECIEGNAVL